MTIQIDFEIQGSTALGKYIQGKSFYDEKEFLEVIEDYVFGKMIQEGDTGELVPEEEIFTELNS